MIFWQINSISCRLNVTILLCHSAALSGARYHYDADAVGLAETWRRCASRRFHARDASVRSCVCAERCALRTVCLRADVFVCVCARASRVSDSKPAVCWFMQRSAVLSCSSAISGARGGTFRTVPQFRNRTTHLDICIHTTHTDTHTRTHSKTKHRQTRTHAHALTILPSPHTHISTHNLVCCALLCVVFH